MRDLLLGREPHELDFVVEGDAVAVARRAAERLGGRVTVHDRFGTATVEAPDATFDLAGARRERYERPGALPDVELGASLREDLARRDFTVNAIALHLADGELSRIRRPRRTCAARLLRVLHDGSFRDDPTRLLRLVRYGARLGFEPDPRTDELRRRRWQAARLTRSPARGWAPSCGCCCASRSPRRCRLEAARARRRPARAALRRWTPDRVRSGDRPDPAGRRRRPRGARGDARGRPTVAATLDRLGFPAGERDTVAAAATHAAAGAGAERGGGDAGSGARAPPRRPRPSPSPPRSAATRRPRNAGSATSATAGWRSPATTSSPPGSRGPPVGAALDAATEAMLDGRAPTREAQVAAGLEAAGA